MKKLLIVLFLGSGFAMMGQTKVLLSIAGEKVPYTPIPTGTSGQYIKGDHTIGDFSVSNTLTGSNLTTTVNGVTGQPVNLAGAITTTNMLTNPVNTITSNVNGVSVTAPAVNSVENTYNTNNELVTTVNGISSSGVPILVTNRLTGQDGQLVSTVNGVPSSPFVPVLIGVDGGLSVDRGLVKLGGRLQGATILETGGNVNTLAITNLNAGTATDDLIVANSSGVLRKLPFSTISSTNWGIKGNAGTNATTDFIGTTDPIDLNFRRGNVKSGFIGSNNTAFGLSSLTNSTGGTNVAFGAYALTRNTTGAGNTAFGYQTLYENTTGNDNIAIGRTALFRNTVGEKNIGIGGTSLVYNTTGSKNVAIGFDALEGRSSANSDENTAIGNNVLSSNTIGSYNTAVGANALSNNETGHSNTVVGFNSGLGIASGSKNTIIGANVGQALALPGGITNNIIIADGDGNRRINVNAAGNVGIGTNDATAKLEISRGSTAAGSVIKIVDGSEGSGKVLTSDANGFGTWTAIPSVATTNALSSLNNIMTSNVNGVSRTAAIINNVENTVTGSTTTFNLTTSVNGISSSTINMKTALDAATTNTLTLAPTTNNLISTVNGKVSNATGLPIVSEARNGLTRTNGVAELGGDITKATTLKITTGTLAITGLGAGANTDDLLVADASGVLKKLDISSISSTDSWKTSGNSGTDPANDFIGTTDANKDLVFKRANIKSGWISATNTAFGASTLPNPTVAGSTGIHNTAFGSFALSATTTGKGNVGIGYEAMKFNTTGSGNTAIGYQTLKENTTAVDNTAVGSSVLANSTSGGRNTAIGARALSATTNGSSNVGVGYEALRSNTEGEDNIAVGRSALTGNLVGNENVAIGGTTLPMNTGSFNTAVGHDALEVSTTGEKNTAIGHSALKNNRGGGNNTVLGYNSGIGIVSGNANTIIGANVGATPNTALPATLSNNIIIADGAGNRRINVDANGKVGIGTISTATTTAKLEINTGTTNGAIKIVDGTQGSGKVLTSDANGLGTWQTVAAQAQPIKVHRVASATLRQQTFNLTSAVTGTHVSLFINGMRISDPAAVGITNSTTLTYDKTKNNGYELQAGDTVVFEYM